MKTAQVTLDIVINDDSADVTDVIINLLNAYATSNNCTETFGIVGIEASESTEKGLT